MVNNHNQEGGRAGKPEARQNAPKFEMCRISAIADGELYLNFRGYGLKTKNTGAYKEKQVIRVNFTGEIGKPGFRFWL